MEATHKTDISGSSSVCLTAPTEDAQRVCAPEQAGRMPAARQLARGREGGEPARPPSAALTLWTELRPSAGRGPGREPRGLCISAKNEAGDGQPHRDQALGLAGLQPPRHAGTRRRPAAGEAWDAVAASGCAASGLWRPLPRPSTATNGGWWVFPTFPRPPGAPARALPEAHTGLTERRAVAGGPGALRPAGAVRPAHCPR